MAMDRIANVKFMVAKTLLLFWGTNDQKLNQQIQACMKTLCNDPDADVKYFAWASSSSASKLRSNLSILE
jgi:hypothetical protein